MLRASRSREHADRAPDLEAVGEAPPVERRDRGVVLRRLVRAGLEVPRVGVRGVELVEEGGRRVRSRPRTTHSGHSCAPTPLAAEPGDERVEPVLQHEQLEVAAGTVQPRAGRERPRAGRAARLVEDRPRPRRRRPARSWIEIVLSGPGCAACSNQRSIVACAVTIRPAASARRSSVSGLRGEVFQRRLDRRVEDARPAGRGADRVAAELRLAGERAEAWRGSGAVEDHAVALGRAHARRRGTRSGRPRRRPARST